MSGVERVQINMLLAVLLSIAGFIAIQVWDIRGEVIRNNQLITGLRSRVIRIDNQLDDHIKFHRQRETKNGTKPHT